MGTRFADSVVVVAGGTGALGSAASRAFLNEGARVIATYRTRAEFDALVASAGAAAARLEGRAADVTDERAARELIDALVAQHGRIDVLINTVGGYVGAAKLWAGEAADLERMLTLNLRSGHALARTVVPVMLRQGRGSIVNVAAKAAIEHRGGAAAYTASKAAALALMDALAAELAGTGVRVNSLLPTIIDTQANRRAMPHADFAKWAKPEDIAGVMLILCTAEAGPIHGAAIVL